MNNETYYYVDASGAKYGPASMDDLNRWAMEGRIGPDSLLEATSTGLRMMARYVPGFNVGEPRRPGQPTYGQQPQQPRPGAAGQSPYGQTGQSPYGQTGAYKPGPQSPYGPGAQNPYQPGGQNPYGGYQPSPYPRYGPSTGGISNVLIKSILATLCCCLPLGVVSIVYAAQVDGHARSGNQMAADDCARKADLWANWSIVMGIVGTIFWIVLRVMMIGLMR